MLFILFTLINAAAHSDKMLLRDALWIFNHLCTVDQALYRIMYIHKCAQAVAMLLM